MKRRFERGILFSLIAALVLLTATGFAEEASVESVYPEEIGEIDLFSPEIYVEEAEEERITENQEASESQDAPPVDAPSNDVAPAEGSAVPVEDPEAHAVAAPASFPTSLTLGVKENVSLNGTLLSGGQAVTYASSKPKIASVDESGAVQARKAGKATITVFQGQTALGACEVTVMKAPKKLAYPDKSIVMSKDQTRAYPVSMPKGCAGAVAYASDNPAVLTVDAAGNLRGVSGGSATVTATAYNGKKASCAVRVLGGPAPTWVKLNQTSANLPVKGTLQLTASFDAGRDAILSWSTSNKKLVTVNDSGLVTAKKAGQATVTVTTHNGLTAACNVQVYVEPKKVSLNAKKLTLNVNDGYQLTATLTKNSVTTLTWGSDNPGVVSVDGNGLLAANKAGTANVTVTTANGKKAKCKVTVKPGVNSDPANPGIRGEVVFQEESETLKVTISNDNGVYLAYIWAANPSRQLFKRYGNARPGDILQDAVNRNGLTNKLVIGFNASPPVNETYRTDWNKDPNYRHREPSPLMISNGEALVNDPNKTIEEKYLYWLDGNGQLRHSAKRLEDMTVEARRSLYSEVIASGARNTMIWQPVLVSDYRAVPLSSLFLNERGGKQKKHALCQMDSNNFIVVSSSDGGKMDYPGFQKYLLGLGCKTAVEFDAGGSTSMLYKPGGSALVKKATGGGRVLTMVMYFTEM